MPKSLKSIKKHITADTDTILYEHLQNNLNKLPHVVNEENEINKELYHMIYGHPIMILQTTAVT